MGCGAFLGSLLRVPHRGGCQLSLPLCCAQWDAIALLAWDVLPWCTCWVSCSSGHADILLIPLNHLPLTLLPAALWSRQEIPCEVITAQAVY